MRTSRIITRIELGLVLLGVIAVVGGACPATAASGAAAASDGPNVVPPAAVASPASPVDGPVAAAGTEPSADASAYWHLGDPDEPFAPEDCVQIRGGEHCFSFSPGWAHIGYRWLGEEPIDVQFRIGVSSLPSPGCNSGTPVLTTPPFRLGPRHSVTVHQPAPSPANWSGTLGQTDEDGRVVSVRSVACEYGPVEP